MIELIVEGRPKSLQSSARSLDGWRKQVEAAANTVLPQANAPISEQPVYASGPVHAGFHWFCDMGNGGIADLDNVLKPTFDALEGLAFTDDAQLSDIHATRVDLDSLSHDRSLAADCESWPEKLLGHVELAKNLKEFVYIQIVDPPNLLEVPWLPQH